MKILDLFVRNTSTEKLINILKLLTFNCLLKNNTGTIDNICEAVYKGTLYESCSNGERINIGLDIINGLQNIFGVSAPIFIDNAEAVKSLVSRK